MGINNSPPKPDIINLIDIPTLGTLFLMTTTMDAI